MAYAVYFLKPTLYKCKILYNLIMNFLPCYSKSIYCSANKKFKKVLWTW